MGTVYRRKDSALWWVAYYDESGKRRLRSTKTIDESEAKRTLSLIEKRVAMLRATTTPSSKPTVREFAKDWLEAREKRGLATARDDRTRIEKHALPRIGSMRMDEVRSKHMRAFVRQLEVETKLAQRTRRHVYDVLRTMFADAVADEIIPATPCTLKERRGELPPKRDKDPAWRSTAVFSRAEVEALISDPRIPEYRRVRYGLEFLAGLRVNEITPRRWADWHRQEQPLSRLAVLSTYQPKAKKVKPATKTGVVREVPVHPTLSALLDRWWELGWAAFQERAPKAEDLIIPRVEGEGFMSSSSAWKRLQEDLALLGFRARRQHDARRTFISLAQADGANRDKLRVITHGQHGDIVGAYTTLPWHSLCEEVAKLKISLPETVTALLRQSEQPEKIDENTWRRRESKARPLESYGIRDASDGLHYRGISVAMPVLRTALDPAKRNNVAARCLQSAAYDRLMAEIGAGPLH